MQHKTLALAATFLAFLFPLNLGAQEHPVPPPALESAPISASTAASDGRDFLLVGGSVIRVSADGALLDAAPTVVNPNGYADGAVFAAGKYAVFWFSANALNVTRIDAATGAADAAHVVMETPATTHYVYATNGKTIVALARDHYNILDAEGRLIERDVPLPVLDPERLASVPWLASNGSTYLLAWVDTVGYRQLVVLPLDENGRAQGAARPIRTILRNLARLASDGRDFLLLAYDVAWTAQRIAPDGTPGERIVVSAPTGATPSIVWGGANYLLLYNNNLAVRLDRDGRPLDAQAVNTSVTSNAVAAPDSRRMFVLDNRLIIDTATLQTVGSMPSPLQPRAQSAFAIAAGREDVMVAWFEREFRAALMKFDGTIIATPQLGQLAVFTFDGTNYVAAWWESFGVRVMRISPDGATLQRTFIPGGDDVSGVGAVWSNGANTLVLCNNRLGIGAILLDAALGVRVATQVTYTRYAGLPAVAWDGREWLVAFANLPLPCCTTPARHNAYAVRVGAAGFPIDTEPLVLGEALPGTTPRVAWDGGEFAVFWTLYDGIHARHVRMDGNLRQNVLLLPTATLRDAAWDGERYVLLAGMPSERGLSDLTLHHADVLLSATTPAAPLVPPVSAFLLDGRMALAGARTFLTYSRRAIEPPFSGGQRVFVREVKR